MDQIHLIATRRDEVEKEISRLKSRVQEMEAELAELDTAGKVLARLSGAKWNSAGAVNATQPPKPSSSSKVKKLTMPKMIESSLRQAHIEHKAGLEPREVTAWISRTYDPEVKGEYVSAIAWRMWKRGQLEKEPNSPVYSLPGMNKSEKKALANDFSDLLDEPEAQGREAGPGGGT
jgi:hypothetical protein